MEAVPARRVRPQTATPSSRARSRGGVPPSATPAVASPDVETFQSARAALPSPAPLLWTASPTLPVSSPIVKKKSRSAAASRAADVVASATHAAILGLRFTANPKLPDVPPVLSPVKLKRLAVARPTTAVCARGCCGHADAEEESKRTRPTSPSRPPAVADRTLCCRQCCVEAVDVNDAADVKEMLCGSPGFAGTVVYDGEFCDRRVAWRFQHTAPEPVREVYRQWNANHVRVVQSKFDVRVLRPQSAGQQLSPMKQRMETTTRSLVPAFGVHTTSFTTRQRPASASAVRSRS